MTKRKNSRQNTARKKYLVDIITPVFGGAHHLDELSKTLLYDFDAGIEFHWIIVDDFTPEDKGKEEVMLVLDRLKEHEDVTVIKNPSNGGFSKTNNIGVRKGKAKYILMLNSDTLITHDGWLAQMVSNIQENSIVGVVGARLIYFDNDKKDPARPSGMTQHAGVGFNLLGQPYHLFSGWPSDHPKVLERRVMRAVTGACLLTTRKLWKHLGGLAEVYTVGNFEDVEYCIKACAIGHAVVYDPKVTLRHYAGGSGNSITAVRNYEIFKLRNSHLVVWDDWYYY